MGTKSGGGSDFGLNFERAETVVIPGAYAFFQAHR
ncbi:hypothetical protein ACVIOG_002422 [Rhizobium leguminosarum]